MTDPSYISLKQPKNNNLIYELKLNIFKIYLKSNDKIS